MTIASNQPRRITIDFSHHAASLVEQYLHDVEMLAGMVVECVEEEPRNLLSPILRGLLAEKAKSVKEQQLQLTCKGTICIDAPCIKDEDQE